jgi:hypothetical protein
MTSRNFDRLRAAERLRAERSADPQDITPTGSRRDKPPLRGCRDHWDGDPFPVTVAQVSDLARQPASADHTQAA